MRNSPFSYPRMALPYSGSFRDDLLDLLTRYGLAYQDLSLSQEEATTSTSRTPVREGRIASDVVGALLIGGITRLLI